MSHTLFAVVEIGPQLIWLVVGAVFVLTFLVVCAVAFKLTVKKEPGPPGSSSFRINLGGKLPVSSQAGFERLGEFTAAALSRPELTPEKRAGLERLGNVRDKLDRVRRGILTTVGLAGLAGAWLLYSQATPANMLLLPAGIVFLLSLGALISGMFPRRSIVAGGEIDPALLDKIQVQVSRPETLTVQLTDEDLLQASDMLRQGWSWDDVSRAMHPGYDGLGDVEKQAVQAALQQAIRKAAAR